ncbi:DC-STAMP domain-containing protein 2 isoform X2 [Dermacentor albipictus]|uniref:DC-STAMP domain-containing protein 2 isoform X2 n=1 Tax=Dermacentor albipictus TaxID=60249 RepID=UPI0038FCC12D
MATTICSLLVRKLFTGRLMFWVQQQRYMYSVRRALGRYKLERANSWRRRCGLQPVYPPLYRLQRFISRVLCASFCACCHGGRLDRADFQGGGRLLKSLQPNTFENRVLKSFLGFWAGALLTVLLNLVLVRIYQTTSFVLFLVVFACGTFLMLGAAFSDTVRCLILLTLPQLFSREGRLALTAYIYFLVLTGPAENFAANVEVLSRGLSCGQEKVANETRRMLEVATSPLKVAAIRRAIRWLYNLVNVCNRRMGEPYEKCRKPLMDAYADCLEMMPDLLEWICSPVKAVEQVCYVAKVITVLCAIPAMIIDFVKVQVIDRIERAMRSFLERAYTAFYVNVTVTHQYNYSLEFSRTPAEVRSHVLKELHGRVAIFAVLFKLLSNGVLVGFLYVAYGATQYRYRYLHEDDFDNYYITWLVEAIDKRRARKGLEALLPLKTYERRRFVAPFSARMTRHELQGLWEHLWTLAISAAHTAVALLLDYTLFRLVAFVRALGKINVGAGLPTQMKLHVQGRGPLADMYRQVADSLSPSSLLESTLPATNVQNCLLRPYPPDIDMYQWIGVVYLLGVALIVGQTYGLRLRHVVASAFHPDRERARAAWLHAHVLSLRTGWLTGARRALRLRWDASDDRAPGLVDMLLARLPVVRKALNLVGIRRKHCLSCGTSGAMDDEEAFRQCLTPTCRAVYCVECFEELENVCTVCLNPADYGDLSDVSEEKDSSEVECDEGDSSESDEFETIRDFLRRRSSATARMAEGTWGAETPRPLQFLDV